MHKHYRTMALTENAESIIQVCSEEELRRLFPTGAESGGPGNGAEDAEAPIVAIRPEAGSQP